MTPEPFAPDATSSVARLFRFKWIALCGVAVFAGVHLIHLWLAQRGFRREARIVDDLLVALLVFVLLVIQRLNHERELRRHGRIMGIIADMNHHTRNALQVIVMVAEGKPLLAPEAIDEISDAVERIEWCLREILPSAGELVKSNEVIGRSHKSGR